MDQQVTQGETLKVTPKAPLKFYYVKLPIVDLSFRVLGRFSGPVDTIFAEYKIHHNLASQQESTEESLKKLALESWKTMVEAALEGLSEIPGEMDWMLQYKDVELIECEIVTKGGR